MPRKVQNRCNQCVVSLSGLSTAAVLKVGGFLATPGELGGLQSGSMEWGELEQEEKRLSGFVSQVLAQAAMMMMLFPMVMMLPLVILVGRTVSTKLPLQSRNISGDSRLMMPSRWAARLSHAFLEVSSPSACAVRGCDVLCSRQGRGRASSFFYPTFHVGLEVTRGERCV